jgi:hypothetical protein
MASVKHVIVAQYLRTAIPALCQYPTDGIRETSSNNLALFERNVNIILLVDRCEKGGTIIPVTDKGQFDGVKQCIYTHK